MEWREKRVKENTDNPGQQDQGVTGPAIRDWSDENY
jgi:hypothetical protein